MTVRTWFTLSALAIVALFVAVGVRLFAPVSPPDMFARVGETRIDGVLVEGCWPQRGDDLRCVEGDDEPEPTQIPADGDMRVVVVYPAQPEDGTIEIVQDGDTVIEQDWTEQAFAYELEPGDYGMTAAALYPEDTTVTHRFALTVE